MGSIICFILAIGFAGNWIYNPLSMQNTSQSQVIETFRPMVTYPTDDPPDTIYHSNYTYIESKDIYYIEYSYVWLGSPDHTPDTEHVRIYTHGEQVEYIELCIHYEWITTTEFKTQDNHLLLSFLPVYHTPMLSTESIISMSFERTWPIILFSILGVIVLIAGIKL